MTSVDRDMFISALTYAGLDEDALHEGYSGRAMFGATCLGVQLDSAGQLLELGAGLHEMYGDVSDFTDVRTDSLGQGVIAYWPGVTLTDEEDE